jgi:hypothetical protein
MATVSDQTGLRGDQILASAARYLIDGGEEDAASVLLACSIAVWESGDTWYEGDELYNALHVALTGPRAAYEALNRTTKLDAYWDAMGMPQQMRDEAAATDTYHLIPADAELAPIVRPAIERAIEAVLPPGFYVKHFTTHVELLDIDPDWRNELLEIARGRDVTNQGVSIKGRPLYTWKNLRFRSKSEMRVAQALDRANVLFFPNSMARLGTVTDARENREPDFLVCESGRWGILEVHGEPWHPPTRAVQDADRARLFKQHGIKVVEPYDATRCYEMPDDVVADFLRLLASA